MKILRLAALEFGRFRGPVRRLVPIGLALIPLLYGALYLWSNWDPYGKTAEIPVAVTIEDQPVQAAGQIVDAGKQFEQQLRATPQFDWHFVDAAQAHDGLVHGRYYFTIHVPKDFSAKLADAKNPRPERASMQITLNDANNYIVGVVADAAKSELQNQINTAAHAAYARAIYGELSDVKEKLRLAAQATDALVDGTELSQQGAQALQSGLAALQRASGGVTSSADDLAGAVDQLSKVLDAVGDSAGVALPAAGGALRNAADAGEQGLSLVVAGSGIANGQATQAANALAQFKRAHPELSGDPLLNQAVSSGDTLAESIRTLDRTARSAHASTISAQRQARTLQTSLQSLAMTLRTARAPSGAVAAATRAVAGAARQVNGGLDSLKAGADTLHTGSNQLNKGANTLSGLVDDALDKIPDTNPEQTAQAADVLGSPVGISTSNLHPAGVYGRGLAPFFFSIALWVLGLMAFLFLNPVNVRALTGRLKAPAIAIAGWIPVAVLGAAGGLVLYGAVQVGLGLDPLHPVLTAVVIVVGATTFVAIDQLLKYALGTIGAALSLALLIIQLTSCGGLYPIETTPAPFRALHPIMPMTYLVDALRVTISGGLGSNLIRDLLVLVGFGAAALVGTSLVIRRRRVWTVRNLHPPIEV